MSKDKLTAYQKALRIPNVIPRFCFVCGSELEEIGLGWLQCKSEKCENVYLPFLDKENNQNMMLQNTSIKEYNKGDMIEDVEVEIDYIPGGKISGAPDIWKSGFELQISVKPTKTCWSREEVEKLCRKSFRLAKQDTMQELQDHNDYSIEIFLKETL